MEALPLQRALDVADHLAEWVGNLGLEVGQRGLGSLPFRGQPLASRAARGVSRTVLLRASGPAEVRTSPAARIAATFWLTAEWVS